MSRRNYSSICFLALFEFLLASPLSHAQRPQNAAVGGVTLLEEGQPPVVIHATVDNMTRFNKANPIAGKHSGGTSELSYRGGTGGIGVETAPKIYVVFWG